MRGLIMALLVSLASLAHADEPEKFIDVQHDAHRGVTCWILNDKAISCLPDSQLRQPSPKPQQRQRGVNPASSSILRPHEEVFQL